MWRSAVDACSGSTVVLVRDSRGRMDLCCRLEFAPGSSRDVGLVAESTDRLGKFFPKGDKIQARVTAIQPAMPRYPQNGGPNGTAIGRKVSRRTACFPTSLPVRCRAGVHVPGFAGVSIVWVREPSRERATETRNRAGNQIRTTAGRPAFTGSGGAAELHLNTFRPCSQTGTTEESRARHSHRERETFWL
jgi:hypothetical protein